MDHDLLPAETSHFRLRKQTRFSEVKQMVGVCVKAIVKGTGTKTFLQ